MSGLELTPFGGKTERMMNGCSSQTTKDGLLGNRVTSIDWRCVGNVDQKRELCRGLLRVTAKECRSSIEPKTAKVRLDIGDRGEFLDDGGGDLLGAVTSRIKGETPESVQSILRHGSWSENGTYSGQWSSSSELESAATITSSCRSLTSKGARGTISPASPPSTSSRIVDWES